MVRLSNAWGSLRRGERTPKTGRLIMCGDEDVGAVVFPDV